MFRVVVTLILRVRARQGIHLMLDHLHVEEDEEGVEVDLQDR
jgi:hypothetical protein